MNRLWKSFLAFNIYIYMIIFTLILTSPFLHSSSNVSLGFGLFFFFFCSIVFRVYFLLYTQRSLLEGWETIWSSGDKTWLATCNTNTLSSVLLLSKICFSFTQESCRVTALLTATSRPKSACSPLHNEYMWTFSYKYTG